MIKKNIKSLEFHVDSDKYFWNYRWTLDEFLAQGLTKFLEKPLEEFKKFDNRSDEEIEDDAEKRRNEEFNLVWRERVASCGRCKNGFVQGEAGIKKCDCVINLKKV